jgi:inactivated superfamily I helicase
MVMLRAPINLTIINSSTMAHAGDGATRLNKRKRAKMINLRTSADEKFMFEEMARRNGFKTMSAWALDRLRSDGGMSLRDGRVLIGKLGKMAAPLRTLVRQDRPASPDVLQKLLQSIEIETLAMQNMIWKGDGYAGKSDPEPHL